MRLRLLFALAGLGLIVSASDAKAFFFCKKGGYNQSYGCGGGYGGGWNNGYGGYQGGWGSSYAPGTTYSAEGPGMMATPTVRVEGSTMPATGIAQTDNSGVVQATYTVPGTSNYVMPAGYYAPSYYNNGYYSNGYYGNGYGQSGISVGVGNFGFNTNNRGYYSNRGSYGRGWGWR